MDEYKLGVAQNRGVRAAELLGEGSIFNEACQELENECLRRWKETTAPEGDLREHAWRTVKTLHAITGALKGYITNGKLAASDLQRLWEETERKRKGSK